MIDIPEVNKQIESLKYNKDNPNAKIYELEVALYEQNIKDDRSNIDMSAVTFKKLANYMAKKYNIDLDSSAKNLLDIICVYDKDEASVLRITVEDNLINSFDNEFKNVNNNTIISSVLKSSNNKYKQNMILKEKKYNEYVDNYHMKLRNSEEINLNDTSNQDILNKIKSIKSTDYVSILFRYKQRITIPMYVDSNFQINLDLTITKTSNKLYDLHNKYNKYEAELEIIRLSNKFIAKDAISKFNKYLIKCLMLLQDSKIITSISECKIVCDIIRKYVGPVRNNLPGRQAISFEVQNVDTLPNNYALVDKADGERHFIVIYKNNIYLVSNNVKISHTGVVLDDKISSKLNECILDGEFMFLFNKKIFQCFDLCYPGNYLTEKYKIDYKKIHLNERIKYFNMCVEYINKNKDYKHFVFTELNNNDDENKYSMKKIIANFEANIINYFTIFNENITKHMDECFINFKLYFVPYGIKDNEIFIYIDMLWRNYTIKSICPYILDGCMLTPLYTAYNEGDSVKYKELKLKPLDKNSIDFYLRFEKERDDYNRYTDKLLRVYDNSDEKILVKGKCYQIAKLYVGKNINNKEQPVPFRFAPEVYLYVQTKKTKSGKERTDCYDVEGNKISDNTVVEFYYNNDPSIPQKFRWVPLRTRHDKTEIVNRYHRKYGNFYTTAERTWMSINKPVTMDDIKSLTDDKTYKNNLALINSRVTSADITKERQNAYYQSKKGIIEPMRHYHNWIKSNIIYTHFSKKYNKNGEIHLLDIACGRGGDITKFYYSGINTCVGIDRDEAGLFGIVDSAISRYTKNKKKFPDFYKATFIHADFRNILTSDSQKKVLSGITPRNLGLIDSVFSKKHSFNAINCQFALHYFLENKDTWNNFITNLNNAMNKEDCTFICTCFDAKRIHELFENSDSDVYNKTYTDLNGNKNVLFEIIAKYDKAKIDFSKPVKYGHGIDVFNASYMDYGSYYTEYLVDPAFLTKELKEKCGLDLVETQLFENIYNVNRYNFNKTIDYEENKKTSKFLHSIRNLYNAKTEMDKKSFYLSRLYRYYIFKKLNH